MATLLDEVRAGNDAGIGRELVRLDIAMTVGDRAARQAGLLQVCLAVDEALASGHAEAAKALLAFILTALETDVDPNLIAYLENNHEGFRGFLAEFRRENNESDEPEDDAQPVDAPAQQAPANASANAAAAAAEPALVPVPGPITISGLLTGSSAACQ